MFAVIALIIVTTMAVNWYMESDAYDMRQTRKEIERMADRDRTAQRARLPQRRMQYMTVYHPKQKPLRVRDAG